MNRRSILTKTGKGLMEATGKTSNLSRDLRNILKEIDGKVSVSDLSEKFTKMGEPKLIESLSEMEREGYLREFVGKQEEGPRASAGRAASAAPSQADDLDFTAFTPAKPNAKAAEEARLQAQAQEIARQAQATRAREDTAARARAEMAARAKAEADMRARQAAAPRPAAPVMPPLAPISTPILGAGPEAQARAQTEALDRARREAERKEAEEKARKEAEARAKADAEMAVKREAEERLRREIQEKTRREDEERARREAEARAKIEAEARIKREAEERLRREMEERARREIEERMRREEEERRRREEEERARREIDRKAKVEAEARARVEAELRAKREAEERVRRERAEEEERKRQEKEAAEGLERTLREEQEKAERETADGAEREEQERTEQEDRASEGQEQAERRAEEEEERAKEEDKRARHEEKVAAKAAAKLRKAERSRERAGEEAWRGDEDALRDPDAASLSAAEVWDKRKPRSFAKTLAVMLFIILVVGIAVLPFVPLETAAYEKAAQAWLGQPVKIGTVNLSLLPLPQLRFEKVVIGRDPQMKIAAIKASPELGSLLEDRVSLKSLALDNAVLPREFLAALLENKGGRRTLGVERITAKGLKIDGPDIGLPPLDLEASFSADGALRSVLLSSSERQLAMRIEPRGGRAAIEMSSNALPIPIGVDIDLTDFSGKGTISATELVLTNTEARVFGGRIIGKARLRWSSGWSLDGEFSARQMEAVKIAAPLLGSGTVQGRATYTMRGLLPERMVLNSQIDGNFTVQKGSISNVDMTRLLQGSGSGGGTTLFSEMSGDFTGDPNRLLVRQIRMAAGLLNAAGQLEMDAQKNLSGRMQIDLRAASVQARANLGIAGTLTNPQFRRSN